MYIDDGDFDGDGDDDGHNDNDDGEKYCQFSKIQSMIWP